MKSRKKQKDLSLAEPAGIAEKGNMKEKMFSVNSALLKKSRSTR